jgi:hypothetical protein
MIDRRKPEFSGFGLAADFNGTPGVASQNRPPII